MSQYRKRKRGSARQIGNKFRVQDKVINYVEPQMRIYPVQHQWTVPHKYTTMFTYQNGRTETVTSIARDPKTALVQAMAERRYKNDIPVGIQSENQILEAALALGGLALLTRLFSRKDPGTSSEVDRAIADLKSEDPRIQNAGQIRLQTLLERERGIIPQREQIELEKVRAKRGLEAEQARAIQGIFTGTAPIAAGALAGRFGGEQAVSGISALRGVQQAQAPAPAAPVQVYRPPPSPPSTPVAIQQPIELAQPQSIPVQPSTQQVQQTSSPNVYLINGVPHEIVTPTPYFRKRRQAGPPGTTVR